MKKFYTVLAATTICVSTCLGGETLSLQAKVDNNIQLSHRHMTTELLQSRAGNISDIILSGNTSVSKSPAKAAPSGTWTNIGKGKWVEGPLDLFSDIKAGWTWEVDIEQHDTDKGWYRLLPYNENSPVSQLLGQADTENYVYVNATNPTKVYVEDYAAFGSFQFSQLCPENGWGEAGYAEYGTLKDKIISFPAESFGYYNAAQQGWTIANKTGKFQIALPGADLKDYSLEVAAQTLCVIDGEMSISVTRGTDVAAVKFINLDGMYSASGANANLIAAQGQELPIQYNAVTITVEKAGLYSFLVVALDNAGTVQSTAETSYFCVVDDNDNWKSLGKGKFDEGIYSSAYSDIPLETLDVEIQEHKTQAGRYRLVNPYSTHSMAAEGAVLNHQGHNHYIIINATNPNQVYVEASPVGFQTLYGEGAVWSQAGMYLEGGVSAEEIANAGMFGKLSSKEITMPDGKLLQSETDYSNGAFLAAGKGFKVTLPNEGAGIDNVSVNSDADAPAEYFNLQGVRVANPQPGQLVIKRQGATVTKMIAR